MKFLEFKNNFKYTNNGVGKNTSIDSVDSNELLVGIAVEMEHDEDDLNVAASVAIDHLTEKNDYYTELIKSGIVDEEKAIRLSKVLLHIMNNKNNEQAFAEKEVKKHPLSDVMDIYIDEPKKSPEDLELDEILGYKPMNVGDYSNGDKKYFKENFDFDHAELEYEKNPDLKTKLEKFKNLYTNWKQLQDQEKQEAFNLYKELRMDKFDKIC